jgi:hypothetical protein
MLKTLSAAAVANRRSLRTTINVVAAKAAIASFRLA